MDCSTVSEKLPWYCNDSLEPEEKTNLAAHLDSCTNCCRELEETRQTLRLFAAHIPVGTLVDFARSDTAHGKERPLIEDHLQTCQSCDDELGLIRQSFAAIHDDPYPPSKRRPFPGPNGLLAVAALLILAMGIGWRLTWLRLRQQGNQAPFPSSQTNQGAWAQPQADYLALNLFPRESNQRSAGIRMYVLPTEGKGLALTLHSQLPIGAGPYRLEIWDRLEQKLWDSPLTRQADGTFTLILPGSYLNPEGISLRLMTRSRESVAEHYDLGFQAGK